MRDCIYPGSFDPATKGHLDIIKRSSLLFDKVYIAVLNNFKKKYMFSLQERVEMVNISTQRLDNVEIVSSDGLLTDLMRKLDTRTIIRGLRSGADLELEQQLAVVNSQLLPGAETIVLLSKPEMQYVSSSIVKELITYNADVSQYVPVEILDIIHRRKT